MATNLSDRARGGPQRPSAEDLEAAADTLADLADYLEANEPSATVSIARLRQARDTVSAEAMY